MTTTPRREHALGWDAHWQQALERVLADGPDAPSGDAVAVDEPHSVRRLVLDTLLPGRVIAQHRDRWIVGTGDGDRPAVVAGALRHRAAAPDDLPAVGDWVLISIDAGLARIEHVLPRRGALRRRAAGDAVAAQLVAANVDLVLVLAALVPEPNVRRLERSLAIAWESGAVPLVVLTKTDLHEAPDTAAAVIRGALPGTAVVALSSTTRAGLDALAAHLRPGRTAVLLGPSGAGKSTLINRLLGTERLRTYAVRDDGKGRHTTTHRELVPLPNGALLIDTPGTRELGLWEDGTGLATTFDDIVALAAGCRFADCMHESEPDCAVRAAIDAGTLDPDRLAHWHKLRRELEWLERKHDHVAAEQWNARARSAEKSLRARLREKGG